MQGQPRTFVLRSLIRSPFLQSVFFYTTHLVQSTLIACELAQEDERQRRRKPRRPSAASRCVSTIVYCVYVCMYVCVYLYVIQYQKPT